ncbi:MAG: hypothetical protein HY268_28540 [Deltaproteobacteria bacterium]|nr:hypothetical protein [Deltaproteobacteria bacterium]
MAALVVVHIDESDALPCGSEDRHPRYLQVPLGNLIQKMGFQLFLTDGVRSFDLRMARRSYRTVAV